MNPAKFLLVFQKHQQWLIIGIVLVSIILQLGVALYLPESLSLAVDGERYVTLRDNLVTKHVFAIRDSGEPCRVNQPLYPLLIALIRIVFGESLLPIKLIQVLLNTVLMGATVLLARQLLPKKSWIFPVALFMLYPSFLVMPALIMTETLYIFFLGLSSLCIVRSIQRQSLWGAVLSGVGMGLVMLTRSPTYFLPLALVIPFMWAFGRKKKWRQGAVFCLLFLTFYGLVLLPWGIRNYVVMGEFAIMSCESGADLWVPSNPDWGSNPSDLTKMIPERYMAEFLRIKGGDYYIGCEAAGGFREVAFQNIRGDPLGYIKRKARAELIAMSYLPLSRGFNSREILPPISAIVLFVTRVVQVLLWMLGLIGVFKFWRSHPVEVMALTGMVAYFILVNFFTIPNTRFFLPIMPIVLTFAVHGILTVYELLRSR